MLSLFTFQGQLTADDVLEAIDVKVSEGSEGLKPEDEVLVKFLQRCMHNYIPLPILVCTYTQLIIQ